MKIQGIELTKEHIGSPVTYVPDHVQGNVNHPDAEHGHLSSFNDKGIWVRFKSPNGAKCKAEHLVWG